MALKTLVIDDELNARENLKLLLEDFCTGFEVVGLADGPASAKQMIKEHAPEVVFCDIRMPSSAEGFDLIESLDEINFTLVFVTAFKDYAIKAFKANAIDYILKPVSIDELIKVTVKISKYHHQFGQLNQTDRISNSLKAIERKRIDKIAITHLKGIDLISTTEITHLKSDSNYTDIFTKDGMKHTDSKTLKTYHSMLPEEDFMRIHQSYLVNKKHILGFSNEDGNFIKVYPHHLLPVSRSNMSMVSEFFKQFQP